jgi:tubulin N-terminal N-acetyltransferase
MGRHDDVIQGKRVRLVPYLEEHVPLYHFWLEDPEMPSLTCTETVTLQEEYEHQRACMGREDRIIKLIEVDGVLIGDINLFANDSLEMGGMWEVNMMIARRDFRRQGYASEALELLLKECHIDKVMAKVHKDNQASIELFKKDFKQFSDEPDVFGNITFIRSLD